MIKTNALMAAGLLFSATAAFASETNLHINEIRIDQIGNPDLDEYFELAGDPDLSLAGLTYIVIGDGAGGSGVIEAVIDLSGSSLNANGLFVAAESTFTLGDADLVTILNFENSDNVTHMLVDGFTGAVGQDLDFGGPCTVDEDCVKGAECIDTDEDEIPDTCSDDFDGELDLTPWTVIVSCVALVETPGGGDQIYCDATVGPDGPFVPGHTYFCEAADLWIIGLFQPVGTDDTPGAENPSCTVDCTGGGVAPAVGINEIRVKQAGLEIDEYFELSGPDFASLQGVAYVIIGDTDSQGSGVVEAIICLNGQFILGDGFLVVAEETFSLGDGVADLELPVGDLNFVDADPRTHMLVLNFNGPIGQDVDSNDDGVLDVDLPWEEIIADVALRGPDEPCTDGVACVYSDSVVGPDGDFSPGHVYRCDPDLTWTVGAFDTQPGQPECAQDTPGDPNESCGFVPPCGCSDAGSCFEDNGTANCDDATCCEMIINDFDSTCADDWDQECADLALIECSSCGAANAGNCLVANGTPYCSDETCCNLVCGIDPSCCDLSDNDGTPGWDEECAILAEECDIPAPVQPGDVVLGLSEDDGLLTLELIRGPSSADGGEVVPDPWEQPSIQSVEFDNLNGIRHNDQGNLLGSTYGSVAAGGTIHSFATCTATSVGEESIGDTLSKGGKGLTVSRLGGLSVSPDNTKIAIIGSDTGKVIVYDYTAGNCEGVGASLSGARETSTSPLCIDDTQGTTWLNNNTVLAISTNGELYAVDANPPMAATLLATVPTGFDCGPGYSDIEFNPDISPNVYVMYSAFSGGTTNLLFVLDPDDDYNLLGTFNYSESIETTREIAFDACGNLFVTQYGGSQTPEGPFIDIIMDAANLDSLADNDSVDWYNSLTQSSFSGLDVAIGGAKCVVEKCGTCPTDGPVSGPNGSVGAEDLGWVLGNWGPFSENPNCDPVCPAALICLDDLDPVPGNQSIGAEEISKILGSWGDCPD